MKAYIGRTEMARMLSYSRLSNGSDEIGGLARAVVKDGRLTVTRVFISKQSVSGGTCELDPDDLGRLEYESRNDEGDFIVWWHSHANMGVSPSQQDDVTFKQRTAEAGRCLAIIVNRRGDVSARFAHSGTDMLPPVSVSVDLEVTDITPFTDADIKAEIAKYVSPISYGNAKYTNHSTTGISLMKKPSNLSKTWSGIKLTGDFHYQTRGKYIYIVENIAMNGWQIIESSVEEYLDVSDVSDKDEASLLDSFTTDKGEAYLKRREGIQGQGHTETTDLDKYPSPDSPLSMMWWEDKFKETFNIGVTALVDDADIDEFYEQCATEQNTTYSEFLRWYYANNKE